MWRFFKRFSLPLLLSLISILPYLKLFDGFFQQDEWYGFAWYILHKDLGIRETIKFFFTPSVGHYNPLSIAIQNLFFSIWGMDYQKFLILGLVFHALVTVGVYYLTKLVFKGNKTLAITSALIFAFFASPYQGTGWVVANIATQWSCLLGVVSSILFFKFLESKRKKFFVWSIALLFISLLFKEITIGLFPMFFVVCLLKTKGRMRRNYLLAIFVSSVFYIAFRASMLFAPNIMGDKLVTQSQSLLNLVYNFVTTPLKTLIQIVLPPEFIKMVSVQLALFFPEKTSGIVGSPEFEVFVVGKVMEVFNILFSLVSVMLVVIIARKRRNTGYKDMLIFGLAWVILNSLIFSFAPETSGIISVVDSRNLYFVSVGVAVLIVSLTEFYSKKKMVTFCLILLFVVIFNIFWLNNNLSKFRDVGRVRKEILTQVFKAYPIIPKKAVFYMASDSSYYGLSEQNKTLPFQSGLGQTLLIWYYPTEDFPKSFFENKFLWGITDEGYQEFDGRGFGYFRNYDLLKQKVKEYNLPVDSVISFNWNGKENKLLDMTKDIRDKLSRNSR